MPFHDAILAHCQSHFGPPAFERNSPVEGLPINFAFFASTERRPFLTIATIGLSEKTALDRPDFRRQELLLYLPKEWDLTPDEALMPTRSLCDFLAQTAAHIFRLEIPLAPKALINAENALHPMYMRFRAAVLFPPLNEMPEFSPLNVNGEQIAFNVLNLVTDAEVALFHQQGLPALINKFTEQKLLPLQMDPVRRCAVTGEVTFKDTGRRTVVQEHFEKFFGRGKLIFKNTDTNPVDLIHFPATPERPIHTIATLGLSDFESTAPPGMEAYRRQELLLYLPEAMAVNLDEKNAPATWACMFLFFAARYTIDKHVFMGPGSVSHTEDTRSPVFQRFPYAMYIPPLSESPEFFPLKDEHIGTVEFSALSLITSAEAEFMKVHGQKALIEKMLEKDTLEPAMEPMRPCTFQGTKFQASGRAQPSSAPLMQNGKPTLTRAAAEGRIERMAREHLQIGAVIGVAALIAVNIAGNYLNSTGAIGGGAFLLGIPTSIVVGVAIAFFYAKHKSKQDAQDLADEYNIE